MINYKRYKFLFIPISAILIIIAIIATLKIQGHFISHKKADVDEKLSIIVTTSMIKDAITNIAKDHVRVRSLMGSGVDPHSYKARPKDLVYLKSADIIFFNGLHLEGKMSEILEGFNKIKPTYPVSNALTDSDIIKDREFSEGVDPHIWFDIELWKKVVLYVCKILQKHMPTKSDFFYKNATNYIQQLDELKTFVIKKLNEVPESQRVLITAHDAFGYFGRAFHLEVKGLQGISTAAEYGLKDVTNLINFIISRKIKAIFVETSVSEKPIRAVIEGCGNNGHEVVLGGPIYSDAMGPEGTPDGTYIGMVTANVKTIVRGLKFGTK